MEKARERRKLNIETVYLCVSIVLIVVTIAFSIFRFQEVFERMVRTIIDLALSAAYYVTEIFFDGGVITPTVATVPDGIDSQMPLKWEEFRPLLERYGELLVDPNNIKEFFVGILDGFVFMAELVCIFAPLVMILCWAIKKAYQHGSDDIDHETKPLKVYKKYEEKVYYPVKRFVIGYIDYAKGHRRFLQVLMWLWLYNLNVITIAGGGIAFYLYFLVDFFATGIETAYAQLVKLTCDLSVPIAFLPPWAWLVIGYLVFDFLRKRAGMLMLWFYESCNRAFLKIYEGALFLVGKQRAKKTTIITDMAMSQEVIFRETAKEKLSRRDKQFPHFEWERLEEFYRMSRGNKALCTLARWRRFIKLLRDCFEKERLGIYSKSMCKSIRRNLLLRKYGYVWNDFIFGYDYEKYGLYYNDKLTMVNVFDAIEGYVQMFYIYAAPTTMLWGNYPIRTDKLVEDEGTFPELNDDFFSRDPQNIEQESNYSHIPNLDGFRLGNVYDETDPYINSCEYGVLNGDEWAKERGNQNTNIGLKTTDGGVNPRNDRYEENLKMIGHKTTIEYFTWFRLLLTDQRPDSLGAENKDLCDIIMIRGVSDPKIVMPGFMFEEWLYALTTKIHDKVYYKLRNYRKDANGTLLVYLMKKLYTPIFRHYDRIVNQFSVYTADLKITNAMTQELLKKKAKYYISKKKTYSDRFATDGIKKFYDEKTLKSDYGINDAPTYTDLHMTIPQMRVVKSIWYNRMIDTFMKQELNRQLKEQKGKKKSA